MYRRCRDACPGSRLSRRQRETAAVGAAAENGCACEEQIAGRCLLCRAAQCRVSLKLCLALYPCSRMDFIWRNTYRCAACFFGLLYEERERRGQHPSYSFTAHSVRNTRTRIVALCLFQPVGGAEVWLIFRVTCCFLFHLLQDVAVLPFYGGHATKPSYF